MLKEKLAEGMARLNAVFAAYPDSVKTILHQYVPLPEGMEDYVFHRDLADGTRVVTVLGLLNATLFRDTDRIGYTTPSGEMTRDQELATIEGYVWSPPSNFNAEIPAPIEVKK